MRPRGGRLRQSRARSTGNLGSPALPGVILVAVNWGPGNRDGSKRGRVLSRRVGQALSFLAELVQLSWPLAEYSKLETCSATRPKRKIITLVNMSSALMFVKRPAEA